MTAQHEAGIHQHFDAFETGLVYADDESLHDRAVPGAIEHRSPPERQRVAEAVDRLLMAALSRVGSAEIHESLIVPQVELVGTDPENVPGIPGGDGIVHLSVVI